MPALLTQRPSIVAATLPFSDTKCICRTLSQTLDYILGPSLFRGSFTNNEVVRETAAKFALGGLVGGWHLAGDRHNIEALLHAGLYRILLHVRDPRASALVNARMRYFRDYPDLLEAGRYPKTFTAPTDNPAFDHHIDNFVRKAVIWLTTWLDAIESYPRLNVLVRSHEELMGDPHHYFACVLDFYGIGLVPLQITSMDETLLFAGSEPEAWRQVISAEQLDRLTAMIPQRLFTRFGWAN